jgi:hypothetical protein
MEAFDRLKRLVTEAEIEVLKGEGGNKAAKVRARKKMQEIKNAAQDVRTGLLDAGGEGGEGDEGGEAKKG